MMTWEGQSYEKKNLLLTFPLISCHTAIEEASGWSGGRRQEQGESPSLSFYWGFYKKVKAGQSKQLGLVSLHNSDT